MGAEQDAMTKRLSPYLWPVISRYSAIAIQFLVVLLVARALIVDEAGSYFLLLGTVQSVFLIVGLGAPDGFIVQAARLVETGRLRQRDDLVFRMLAGVFLSSALLGIVLTMSVAALADDAVLALLSGIWLFAYGLVFGLSQLIVGLGRPAHGSFVFYSSVNFVSLFTLVPYLLFAEETHLIGVVAFSAAASLGGAVVGCILLLRFNTPRLDSECHHAEGYWATARIGSPMALGRFVQAGLTWMPVWAASVLIGAAEASLIAVAGRVVGGAGAVLAAVRFSIRPQLASLAAQDNWPRIGQLGRRVAAMASCLAVASIGAAAFAGDRVLGVVFGDVYTEAGLLLLIMLFGLLAESFGGPVDETLKMSGDGWIVLWSQVAGVVVALPLYWYLSRFGAGGIAAAYSLSFVVLYATQIVYLGWRRGVWLRPELLRSRQLAEVP